MPLLVYIFAFFLLTPIWGPWCAFRTGSNVFGWIIAGYSTVTVLFIFIKPKIGCLMLGILYLITFILILKLNKIIP